MSMEMRITPTMKELITYSQLGLASGLHKEVVAGVFRHFDDSRSNLVDIFLISGALSLL